MTGQGQPVWLPYRKLRGRGNGLWEVGGWAVEWERWGKAVGMGETVPGVNGQALVPFLKVTW